jgi:hypothetical protein
MDFCTESWFAPKTRHISRKANGNTVDGLTVMDGEPLNIKEPID